MQRNLLTKVLCWCFVVLLPASALLGDTRAAMLYADAATLNGAPIAHASAVLPGDRIETATTASATLTVNGSSLLLASNSSLIYQGTAVELSSGAIAVTTRQAMVTRAGNLRIVPAANGTAQYQIGRQGGQIAIIAKVGALAITENGVTSILTEGASAERTDTATQDQDQDKKDRKKAGGPIPQGTAGGGAPMSAKTLGIILAAAGGAAAATAIITTRAVSNSHP